MGPTIARGLIATGAMLLVAAAPAAASPILVTNNNDAGSGSLRAAIDAANASMNATDTISFASLPSGEGTIHLTTLPLPQITRAGLVIDGTTFSGGRVVLDGSGLSGADNVGLQFTGYLGGSNGGILKGLEIAGFSGAGVDAEVSHLTITGNLIGTDGTAAKPNGVGVQLGDQDDTVGGTTAGSGNVISGNSGPGVSIIGSSYGNNVQGNVIGLNAAKTAAVPNHGGGVLLTGGQSNNIGTGAPGTGGGNVIAGNGLFGVQIQSGSSIDTIQGNYIGVSPSGIAFSQGTGVDLGSSYNNVGNTFSAPGGNVISGNMTGVLIDGSGTTGNTIAGNLIGFAPNGTTVVGNTIAGVSFGAGTNANTVGGPSGANRIAYTAGETGVEIGSTSNTASQNTGSGDTAHWIVSTAPAPTVTSLGSGMFRFQLTGGVPNLSYTLELYTTPGEHFVKAVTGMTDGSGNLTSTDSVTVPPGGAACATASDGSTTSKLDCSNHLRQWVLKADLGIEPNELHPSVTLGLTDPSKNGGHQFVKAEVTEQFKIPNLPMINPDTEIAATGTGSLGVSLLDDYRQHLNITGSAIRSSCATLNDYSSSCSLGRIPSGESRDFTLKFHFTLIGLFGSDETTQIAVSGGPNDPTTPDLLSYVINLDQPDSKPMAVRGGVQGTEFRGNIFYKVPAKAHETAAGRMVSAVAAGRVITSVKVGILVRKGTTKARCRWIASLSGRVVSKPAGRGGSCVNPVYLPAKLVGKPARNGAIGWRLVLHAHLPRGSYEEFVSARNAEGMIEGFGGLFPPGDPTKFSCPSC